MITFISLNCFCIYSVIKKINESDSIPIEENKQSIEIDSNIKSEIISEKIHFFKSNFIEISDEKKLSELEEIFDEKKLPEEIKQEELEIEIKQEEEFDIIEEKLAKVFNANIEPPKITYGNYKTEIIINYKEANTEFKGSIFDFACIGYRKIKNTDIND